MKRVVGTLAGAAIGAVLGFIVAKVFLDRRGGDAFGILYLALFEGVPVGLLVGALVGWLIAGRWGKR